MRTKSIPQRPVTRAQNGIQKPTLKRKAISKEGNKIFTQQKSGVSNVNFKYKTPSQKANKIPSQRDSEREVKKIVGETSLNDWSSIKAGNLLRLTPKILSNYSNDNGSDDSGEGSDQTTNDDGSSSDCGSQSSLNSSPFSGIRKKNIDGIEIYNDPFSNYVPLFDDGSQSPLID